MTVAVAPSDIEAAAQALIRARKTNLGIEVTMPVVYPNGQLVTVVITVEDGDYLVHDAGQGTMCLTASGARLSVQLEKRLMELAQHYGCEFISGRMSRYARADQLALAIVMVANASRTVGDQSIYIRRHQEADFRDAVTARVRDIVGKRLRQDEEIIGKSGRTYRVPNVVLDEAQCHPVGFVIPLPSRSLIAPHFAEFYDLKQRYDKVANESVYDETGDFRPEDWKLLQEVSHPVPFGALKRRFAEHGWIAHD